MCFIKMALEFAILWEGTGYILYADDNESLIANAMALTFVLEIDDIMFQFIVTDMHKRNMESEIPSIGLRTESAEMGVEELGVQHCLPKPGNVNLAKHNVFDIIMICGSKYLWGRITVLLLTLLSFWNGWCGWSDAFPLSFTSAFASIFTVCFVLPSVLLHALA
jgi:hypothetical protein